MATIKEIAKACNVSIATVSNILNDKPGASKETRELVMQMVKEMDYMPNSVARNLKLKSTRTIGVIAEDMTIFSIPDIIDGITEHCEEQDYQILLLNLRLYKKFRDTYYSTDEYYDDAIRGIRELISKQVDGIIYVAAHERNIFCFPEDLPVPVVLAYGYAEFDRFPSIIVDDVDGAYELIRYVVGKGHTRIGVITGKGDSVHGRDRLVGYQKALYDAQILYDPTIVYTGDWTRPAGYRHTDALLKQGVTAIFCMNDLMAGGVYDRLNERGITVGEQVSVVGFDNREVSSYYNPPLTTVNLPLHDIGYRSSEVIVRMLEQQGERGDIPAIHEIPCHLEVRSSVTAVK